MATTFEQAVAQLTAAGAPMAMKTVEIAGVATRVFENTPPTLRDVFDRSRDRGDQTFLVYEDERWSFEKTMQQLDALGALLVESYGVEPGDRVAIAMRNYPEWIVSFAAVTSIGAIAVSMNAWWTGEETRYALEDSGSSVLIADVERARIMSALEKSQWKIKGEGNAASHLGVTPSGLRSRMKRLGITRPTEREVSQPNLY